VRIGTTGKGIGPAYEDKVARRALRVYDLFYPGRFAEKLKENLDYHNFVLTRYLGSKAVDFDSRSGAGDGRCGGDQAAGHRRFGGAACAQRGRP
jgi:adenylosuccinate synthase